MIDDADFYELKKVQSSFDESKLHYDKPILDHLEDREMAEKIRTVLRTFYSTLKSSDEFLDFVFIRASRNLHRVCEAQLGGLVSQVPEDLWVFSTLNNLNDISTWDEVSQMLGYTQIELEEDFEGYLTVCEKKLGFSREELFDEIKHHYNGFSFDGDICVQSFFYLNFLANMSLTITGWRVAPRRLS